MAEQAQIDELIQKMTAERAALLGALESLSEEEASRSPTDGEWNVKQQMSHLCEMESAYRAWVACALKENGANVDRVHGERVAIPLEEANQHSVAEHTGEMRRQRERTMALIASMRPDDFERRAENKLFGSLTVMQWLRSYYRHDRMHVDQVSGREPEYKPKFASDGEPDQRRSARVP